MIQTGKANSIMIARASSVDGVFFMAVWQTLTPPHKREKFLLEAVSRVTLG